MIGARRASLTAAVAAVVGLTALSAPAPSQAAPKPSVTPSAGAAVGGYSTKVVLTGGGLSAKTAITISGCKNAQGGSVAGSGSISTPAITANGSLTVMLGPFAPSTCTVYATTPGVSKGKAVALGSYTYTTTTVAYVTPVGVAPSLLPIDGSAGDAAFLMATTTINRSTGTGDTKGLSGATGAVLSCGSVNVPAAVTPIGASPASRATITPNVTKFATVPASTACDVIVTLASGNTVDTSAVVPNPGVWAAKNVPSITLSPTSGAASQTPDQAQWVTASGTGLNTATGVEFAYCPSSNPIATYPVTQLKPAADGSSISFPVPDIPPAACTVIITLPASGSRPAGYTIATAPPSGGFTFQPPYQGPITVTITNPHTAAGLPISGITDANLWVSLLADPTGGGTIDVTRGVNAKTLTSVQFSKLDGYNATTHTGTMTFTPPLASGNLYFSNADITGAPPNPLTSTVRYGFAEFTYDDAGLDVDFTLIDQIGLTMSQTLADQNGSVIPDSYRDTGCLVDIVNDLSLAGVNMRATSAATPGVMRYSGTAPTTTPAAGKWAAADLAGTWVGLIGASKSPVPYPAVSTYTSSVTGPLTITDNVGDPKYGGEFSYKAVLANGIWTLKGTVGGGAGGAGKQAGPTILVEAAGLSGAGTKGGTGYGLYAQDGPFKVTLPSGKVLDWSNGSALTGTGWTNVTKTIYRDFIAAFSYGYWGSTYGGGTTTGTNAVNFTMDPVTSAYAKAQPTYPSGGQYAWNVYDQIIRSHSNVGASGSPVPSGAYAMPYSDTFVPSSLSPNQQQGFAHGWTVTLGDPSGCATTSVSLTPATQLVRVDVGTTVATSAYTATGFPGTVTYSIAPALPAGLTLNTSTGKVTGSPTSTVTATTFTITGTSGSVSATATITVAVGADPAPPNQPKPCLPPGILLPNGICAEID